MRPQFDTVFGTILEVFITPCFFFLIGMVFSGLVGAIVAVVVFVLSLAIGVKRIPSWAAKDFARFRFYLDRLAPSTWQ